MDPIILQGRDRNFVSPRLFGRRPSCLANSRISRSNSSGQSPTSSPEKWKPTPTWRIVASFWANFVMGKPHLAHKGCVVDGQAFESLHPWRVLQAFIQKAKAKEESSTKAAKEIANFREKPWGLYFVQPCWKVDNFCPVGKNFGVRWHDTAFQGQNLYSAPKMKLVPGSFWPDP